MYGTVKFTLNSVIPDIKYKFEKINSLSFVHTKRQHNVKCYGDRQMGMQPILPVTGSVNKIKGVARQRNIVTLGVDEPLVSVMVTDMGGRLRGRVFPFVCCAVSLSATDVMPLINVITARVRSMREGTVFTGVCLFTLLGGGVPRYPSNQWRDPIQCRYRGVGGTSYPFCCGREDYSYPFWWGEGRGIVTPSFLVGVSHLANRRYPHLADRWVPWGTPCQTGWGYPPPLWGLDGGTPSIGTGWGTSLSGLYCGTPSIGTGWGTPHQDWMGVPPPSGGRTAQRAPATRRAVCLLPSRRRTFLFTDCDNSRYLPWVHSHRRGFFACRRPRTRDWDRWGSARHRPGGAAGSPGGAGWSAGR